MEQYSAFTPTEEAMRVHPGTMIQSQVLKSLELTINFDSNDSTQGNMDKKSSKISFSPFNMIDRR